MNGATQLTKDFYYMSKDYYLSVPSIPELDGEYAEPLYIGGDRPLEQQIGWSGTYTQSMMRCIWMGRRPYRMLEYSRWLRECLEEGGNEICELMYALARAEKPVVIIGDDHATSVEAEAIARAVVWVRQWLRTQEAKAA